MAGTAMSAHFLVGPTAAGKTAVAQRLAEEDGFDIVSADSMLVYRGMDIGTAKPSPKEQAGVKYWCMDLADPGEHFSVGLYRNAALNALSSIAARGGKAAVVGGTGLYIKALTHGLAAAPSADPAIRAELERILSAKSVLELQEILLREAPGTYEALQDKRNPRRLIRAIELARAGVRGPLESWKKNTGPVLTGLRMSLDQLRPRIERRVRKMYESGLLEEVNGLLSSGFATSSTAKGAIGYDEAGAVLDKRLSLEEAILVTTQRTVQLARRQATWFRSEPDIAWFEATASLPLAETLERAVGYLDAEGRS